MHIARYLYRPVAALAVSLPFVAIFPGDSLAQRLDNTQSVPLLEGARCVSHKSSGGSSLYTQQKDISANRRFYTTQFTLWEQKGGKAGLVCKLDTQQFETLNLHMGVAEQDARYKTDLSVKIYHGDNAVGVYNSLKPGSDRSISLDLQSTTVGKPDNLAIEVLCHQTAQYCSLHFMEAELLRSVDTNLSGTNPVNTGDGQPEYSLSNDTTYTYPSKTKRSASPSSSVKDTVREINNLGNTIRNLFR